MTTPAQQKRYGIDCTPTIADFLLNWSGSAITLVSVMIGMVATFLVYWTVRQQTLSSRRFSFAGQISETQLARTRDVGRQAILYYLAYLNGFLATIFVSILALKSGRRLGDPQNMYGSAVLYVSVFLTYFFAPLQGFFNCLIFFTPRMLKWKQAEPERSWLWCYRKVLSGSAPPPVRRQRKNYPLQSRDEGSKTNLTSSAFYPNQSSPFTGESLG